MKRIVIVLSLIIILTLLQLFARYKIYQHGSWEIRYDRLTQTVYFKGIKDTTWQHARFDDFEKAKKYYQRVGEDLIYYR
jgi:hypothetical protein